MNIWKLWVEKWPAKNMTFTSEWYYSDYLWHWQIEWQWLINVHLISAVVMHDRNNAEIDQAGFNQSKLLMLICHSGKSLDIWDLFPTPVSGRSKLSQRFSTRKLHSEITMLKYGRDSTWRPVPSTHQCTFSAFRYLTKWLELRHFGQDDLCFSFLCRKFIFGNIICGWNFLFELRKNSKSWLITDLQYTLLKCDVYFWMA